MSKITWTQDGDAIALQWGSDGERVVVREGDDSEILKAYSELVASAVLRHDWIEGDVEREIALRMLETEGLGVRKDASDNLYIAWFPYDGDADADDDLAVQLAGLSNGATRPEDIHMTLLYLGAADQWNLDVVNAIVTLEGVRGYPVQGFISGFGRFVIDQDTDAVVALVDSPGLASWRECLLNQLFCYATVPGSYAWQAAGEHAFVPHLTLAYIPKSAPWSSTLVDVVPFTMDAVSVSSAAGRQTFPIGGAYAADAVEDAAPDSRAFYAARDAYAVAKAGRVLSTKNLNSLQGIYDALGTVIDSEMSRRKAEDAGTDAVTGKQDGDSPDKTSSEQGKTQKAADTDGLTYVVTKANSEQRYTFGPLYTPDRKDAHGEWVEADELQKATHDYVQECVDRGDNRLNLQHDDTGAGAGAAGRWVEICVWPYETTVKMLDAEGQSTAVTLPAGTVYMGVNWDDEPWQEVKNGRITGLSMGGRAMRVVEGDNLADMGFKLAQAALTGDEND